MRTCIILLDCEAHHAELISLQLALYDPAIDYYTAHSKRVRRKRNRHSQAVTPYTLPTTSTNIARPLRPEGWTVRYEYKMGCFAEFRGENDVALKLVCIAFRLFPKASNPNLGITKMHMKLLSLCLDLPSSFHHEQKDGPRQRYCQIASISRYDLSLLESTSLCIQNAKIAKLYLYNNEHALALSHHNMHMRKFGDFSRGWGIGEETFEYWSWMARQ